MYSGIYHNSFDEATKLGLTYYKRLHDYGTLDPEKAWTSLRFDFMRRAHIITSPDWIEMKWVSIDLFFIIKAFFLNTQTLKSDMKLKSIVLPYARLFSTLTSKQANYIIECVFETKEFNIARWSRTKHSEALKQLDIVFPNWSDYTRGLFSVTDDLSHEIDVVLEPSFD